MHRHAFLKLRRQPRQDTDGMRRVHADREVMGHAPGQLGLLAFAQQEQRSGDARLAQGHGLLEVA